MFVDLSAACGIAWHHGLTFKLLRTISSTEMVRAVMVMIFQRRFHDYILKSKSRCRTLLNREWCSHKALQFRVIGPALFNLYTYDIPTSVPREYIHVDDIAMVASGKCSCGENSFKRSR